MSFLPILPLQVRAATPDASTTDASAPDASASAPDAGARTDAPAADGSVPAAPAADAGTLSPDASADASAPAPSDAGTAAPSTDAGAPPADASADTGVRGDTESFYVAASAGYSWRGFGSSEQDGHEGPQISLRIGYPTLRMGSQWSLRPELLYRHEWSGRDLRAEFGPGYRSSAELDTLGLGAVLGYTPHPLFGIEAGFHVGATHLGANAPEDGRGGLRYSNNRLGYSADNWGLAVEGLLRLAVPEQRIADVFSLGGGVEGVIGYNPFSLTPDSIARPPSDTEVGVSSLYGSISIYLSARFGSAPAARPAPTPPAAEASPPAESPAPSAPPPVETPPSVAAPTPSAPRLARVPFTVAVNEENLMIAVRDEEGYRSFFSQRIASSDRVRSSYESVRATAFTLTLSVRYGTQSRGSVAVESIRIGETTHRNGHFPPDMAVSSAVIDAMMHAVIEQGLPAYTGNRSRPITVEIANTPAAS